MDILLEKLIKAFGTSSHEEGVRNVIFNKLNELDINYEVDKMDNVIVKMGAKVECEEDKLMFVSHMDTVGLIVTVIDDKGFVKVGNLGDFKVNNIVDSLVVFENGTIGRVCSDKKSPEIDDVYIDLGVNTREEALKKIKEGDVAVFKGEIVKIGENISAPALDNRIGCYMLLKIIEGLSKDREKLGELDKEFSFVFSTQNMLDGRGARAAAYAIDPMYCIVVDTEEASDNLGGKGRFKLGNGVGLHVFDKNLIVHHEVKEILENAFKKANIEPQYVFSEKGTDGGRIHRETNGIKTGVISIPVRYKNSIAEMVNFKDIEKGIEVLCNVIFN